MNDNSISNSPGLMEAIKFNKINRSPVLYLRRQRIKDYDRPFNDGGQEPGYWRKEALPSSDKIFDKHGYT